MMIIRRLNFWLFIIGLFYVNVVFSKVIIQNEFEFPSNPVDIIKEEGINAIKYIYIIGRNYPENLDNALIAKYDKNNKTYSVYQATIPHEKDIQSIDTIDNLYASSADLFNRFKDKYTYLVGNVSGLKSLLK